jgi:hypothetical protein
MTRTARTSKHSPGAQGHHIRRLWSPDGKSRDKKRERQIADFLVSNGLKGESITYFIHADEHGELRRVFVDHTKTHSS